MDDLITYFHADSYEGFKNGVRNIFLTEDFGFECIGETYFFTDLYINTSVRFRMWKSVKLS
jgi:hypothetical protein